MILSVDNLVVRYGPTTVVHGVSFHVTVGQIVAMIGPNGAGKTTCFNAINGQVPSASGSVRINDLDVTGMSPAALWARGVGRTFQITATVASMTVRENVQMGLIAKHRRLRALWPPARTLYRDEADALLSAVGMRDHAERSCAVLAYGDLKRVELAVALTGEPSLLLMDEPTAGMAPQERHDLMALTARLARERNIGVLFTDHDVDIVFAVSDHVLALAQGRLVAQGTPDEIRANRTVQDVYLGGGSTFSAPLLSEAV